MKKLLFAVTILSHAALLPAAQLWVEAERFSEKGRCFSCSHGGPRVMRTTGQMGIATGYAAALCKKHHTTPRGIYANHIQELRTLVEQNEAIQGDLL